jgi:hypothetical protein
MRAPLRLKTMSHRNRCRDVVQRWGGLSHSTAISAMTIANRTRISVPNRIRTSTLVNPTDMESQVVLSLVSVLQAGLFRFIARVHREALGGPRSSNQIQMPA